MSPDAIRTFIDSNAILLMFISGLLVKYFPPLARIPNLLIPWLNVLGYALLKLFGPGDAHAGALDSAAHAGGIALSILAGFTNSIWARQVYEGFARLLLERNNIHAAVAPLPIAPPRR